MKNDLDLLKKMDVIPLSFVEEAVYPVKSMKKNGWQKLAAAAACLVMILALGSIAYAAGAIDAIKAYFSPQNTSVESLLKEGAVSVTDGSTSMRVDHCIADNKTFLFTVSLTGTDKNLTTGNALETAWITDSGRKIVNYNKEIGAYTQSFSRGKGFFAQAVSQYEDADATFIVINELPRGYRIEDLKGVEVKHKNLFFTVELGDSLTEIRWLSPASVDPAVSKASASSAASSAAAIPAITDRGLITDFTASAIGFYFISDTDAHSIQMIKTDGTYIDDIEGADSEGYYGYWASISSIDNSARYEIRGRWGGQDALSTGVLDLNQYCGIRVNGVDYYFEP